MALKKYNSKQREKIVLDVDTELNSSWNYGSDDLSFNRREYYDRYFRLDNGNEEDGYSTYHSPMIQNQVLQGRAYIMRDWNKSKSPIVKFRDDASTAYIDYLFKYELDGHRKLSDSAWNGLLVKTWAAKVGVMPRMEVEEDFAVFEGTNKEEIEDEIDDFFAEEEGIEQVGKTEWEENVIEAALFTPQAPVEGPVDAPEGAVEGVEEGETTQPTSNVPEAAQGVIKDLLGTTDELPEAEPVAEGSVTEYKAIVRFKSERVVRKPFIDIIPPYEFHISRQAPSQEKAGFSGRVTPMTMSELKIAYDYAPKENGYRGKKGEEKFWDEVTGEWFGWTQQNEWYTLWIKDNSTFYEGYYFNVTNNVDSPSHAFLVADVDIWMDPDDSGVSRLYNVVKVGDKILSCEQVSQPSFNIGSPIDIAGRWLGQSYADLIWDEDQSMTNMTRAAENSVLESAYGTSIVDEEQIHLEDWLNREPGSSVSRQINSTPKKGVAAVEWVQHPGLDGSLFQLMETYQERSGTATGVGKFFQPHAQSEIGSTRATAETVQMIENNSELMLEEVKANFWNFWKQNLILLHNASVIGRASPLSFEHKGEVMTVDPLEDLPIVKTAEVKITIGSNEEKDALEKARGNLEAVIELEQFPSLAGVITPEGKAVVVADYFIKRGVDEELVLQLVKPQQVDPLQSEEVQQMIQEATKAAQQQAQQEIEAFKNSEELRMKRDLNFAQIQKVHAEAIKLGLYPEEVAARLASEFELREQNQQKLDDNKENNAALVGIQEEQLDMDQENSDREYMLARDKDIRTEL